MPMIDGERVSDDTPHLVGISPAIRVIDAQVADAARSDAKVLITGESGVGKDVVARLVHHRSRRARRPMAAINCAGIPDSLLESALFGHVRGSFTGAYRDQSGLLEASHNGTIFLDEVAEMSLRMQALLLRFLESGEIQRVGGHSPSRVDVRVIAATNRDPLERVASKDFREDLYYRLNVIPIEVPPLRTRREDVPQFLRYFLGAYAEQHGVAPPELPAEVLDRLVAYDWPGNVRQLKNITERLIVRAHAGAVTLVDLPLEVQEWGRRGVAPTGAAGMSPTDILFDRMTTGREPFWSAVYPAFMARDLTRDDLRTIVQKGLEHTGGSYKVLVNLLNMDPRDYKRFLNFLRKQDCHVPFQRFRTARPWTAGSAAQASN
jgi:transcriptional regulator with PAS, ATPase and Fis domain